MAAGTPGLEAEEVEDLPLKVLYVQRRFALGQLTPLADAPLRGSLTRYARRSLRSDRSQKYESNKCRSNLHAPIVPRTTHKRQREIGFRAGDLPEAHPRNPEPSMRLKPVFANAGIDNDGNLEFEGVLHAFFDNGTNAVLLLPVQIEH